jgi:hypothetical protein
MFPLWFALLGGGSFVLLDVGPSILFLVFPLFWVLWLIYSWQGFIILYIKANVVSIYVDKNWAVPGRFFRSLPFPMVTTRARQGGQGSRCGGLGEVPFLLKKSLGKTGGPASNQTKIQFLKKIIFIIEHIKKIRIFLKKKIETK